ncbi:transposase [Burkholderia anthina]|nr:transposase [Burkholderia anthina]
MFLTNTKQDVMEVLTGPERRRRWTAEQKLAMVRESFEPGKSVSLVARQHGVNPNQLFHWRKLYQDGSLSAVKAGEEVVPASELADALKQIRELQRMLGKKTMENEILREAVEYGRAKNVWSAPALQAGVLRRDSLRKCIRPLASQPLLAARP